jgi:hypothetical protein
MDEWINPLISGGAAVLGALVGTSGTLFVARSAAKGEAGREHRAALVAYYAAVMQFGQFYALYADLMPADVGPIRRVRNTVALSAHGQLLVARMFHLLDLMWSADGRLRTVASAEELGVVAAIEETIADWQIGQPLPDSWPTAVRRLRALVEGRDTQETRRPSYSTRESE